ncbi:MAG: hypothetical protein EBS07_03185 [Sphingobacteriia bacterium]|nr:hypothetical protein [Sphingobacteriia bacterium]
MRFLNYVLLLAVLSASLPKEWLHHDDHAHNEYWQCLTDTHEDHFSAHASDCEENTIPCQHTGHIESLSHSCWLELLIVSASLPAFLFQLPEIKTAYFQYTYLLSTYLLIQNTPSYLLRGPPVSFFC